MKECSIIVVSQYRPQPVGHGGNHRTYQTVEDSKLSMGEDRVHIFQSHHQHDSKLKKKAGSLSNRLLRLPAGIARRFNYYSQNPYRLLSKTRLVTGNIPKKVVNDYRNLVDSIRGPIIALVEHVLFAQIIDLNREKGIPTIACPVNIEAFRESNDLLDRHFDKLREGHENRKTRSFFAAIGTDFGNEVRILGSCEKVLCISKLETDILRSLGLPATYYPYLPVGRLDQELSRVRKSRSEKIPVRGRFLMMGSADRQTESSFEWFLSQASKEGLPEGIELILAGRNTERFATYERKIKGLSVKGWLEQKELQDLMENVTGAILPHSHGFGTLTRIAEYACAGVPVLASENVLFAVDPPPPGVVGVPWEWQAWNSHLSNDRMRGSDSSSHSYADWAREQSNPLADTIRALI